MSSQEEPQQSHSVNEKLADQIEKEWSFIIKRLPMTLAREIGAIRLILLVLQILLIVSNAFGPLGLWESFITGSSRYRDGFNQAIFDGSKGKIDFTVIAQLSLWRGFVVPVLFGWIAYSFTAILCLRHELYHWKPELLQRVGHNIRKSHVGRLIPERWLLSFFRLYEREYEKRASNKIQQEREHAALKDMAEFSKMLKQVGLNLLVSVPVVFMVWMVLLQSKIESQQILELPRSYVPLTQALVWYLVNDMLYFYPHWIAHSPNLAQSIPAPFSVFRPVVNALHKHFKESHRLHHQCKANIGIAAWYCSVWEQVLFNLFPAVAGPVLTQFLADAAGMTQIWGTHLVTLYVWIAAAAASSVIAHSGYRSVWHDPSKHDLHHEKAFSPTGACNFGTFGVFDWLHGTKSKLPETETQAWRRQQDRQAALEEASKRSGVPLTSEQMSVVEQPDYDAEWTTHKEL